MNTGIFYSILYKDYDIAYICDTGRVCNVHLEEHKRAYKYSLRSKLVTHLTDLVYVPFF